MGLEVVDPDERYLPGQGQSLGFGQSDEQRADEPRPVGHGHGVDTLTGHVGPRLDEGVGQYGGEELEVGPPGQLGDDAAVTGVKIDLTAHNGRDDDRAAVDDRGRRLIARRLDAEDTAGGRIAHGRRG